MRVRRRTRTTTLAELVRSLLLLLVWVQKGMRVARGAVAAELMTRHVNS
jgi:hypothetical protein